MFQMKSNVFKIYDRPYISLKNQPFFTKTYFPKIQPKNSFYNEITHEKKHYKLKKT